MSYLNVPRLHFSGTFLANPSTINNISGNYLKRKYPSIIAANEAYNKALKAAKGKPARLKKLQQEFNSLLSWNPFGTGNFEIKKTTVTSFVNNKGKLFHAGNSKDPLIGATFQTVNGPSGAPGKLVDMDADLQVHTRLFGQYLSLVLKGQKEPVMTGYLADNCRLINLWFGRTPNDGNADNAAGGAWQSVVENTSWTEALKASPFLRQLHEASNAEAGLSVRLNVFGYQNTMGASNFNKGTIMGTIGTQGANEPENFLAGRFLTPNGDNSQMYYAAAQSSINDKTLTLDLGNSISVKSPSSPSAQVTYKPVTMGKMEAVLMLPPEKGGPVPLGEIDYSKSAYFLTAGVTQLSLSHLTRKQLGLLNSVPIAIRTTKGRTTVTQLAENEDGVYIEADPATHYMEPNDSKDVGIYARKFGEPVALKIPLSLVEYKVVNKQPNLPGPDLNKPTNAISFPNSVLTDQNTGNATFTVIARQLLATEVSRRRQALRSQLYFISGPWMPGNDFYAPITLKVYFSNETKMNPKWKDVQSILKQYFVLYPVMYYSININLNDYNSVKNSSEMIRQAMMLPFSDGRHMPVTRDMSRDDRAVVFRWINNGCPK